MGGVRSKLRYGVWILALNAAVPACGRTAKNGSSTPEPGEGGAAVGIDPGEPQPNCAVAIAAYGSRHCAAYQDGSVWCWGTAGGLGPSNFEASSEPKQVEGLNNVQQLELGPRHSCALTTERALVCWGDNESGQINDSGRSPLAPTTPGLGGFDPGGIKAFGLADTQTCVVSGISHVYCRGKDDAGNASAQKQVEVAGNPDTTMPGSGVEVFDEKGRIFELGNWDAPEPLTFYGNDNAWLGGVTPMCVLKRSGSLWCTDYFFDATHDRLRVKTQLGEGVVQAGVGDLFMCALTGDGKVWCEGYDKLGQAGRGGNPDFAQGAFVPDVSDVRALAVHQYGACALKSDGSVWCWGVYGTDAPSNVPTQVSGCVKQAVEPPVPGRLSITPVALPTRLAEAGRARGEAVCECATGATTDENCISAEDFAPNAACLAALAPDETGLWQCQADFLWKEATCFVEKGCGKTGNDIPDCPSETTCPTAAATPGVEPYCRRQTCAGDQEQALTKYQICDGTVDCDDGSDERNCQPATRFFECASGTKNIALIHLCDAVPDCDDGSDEQYCG